MTMLMRPAIQRVLPPLGQQLAGIRACKGDKTRESALCRDLTGLSGVDGVRGGFLLASETADQVWDKARAVDGPLARVRFFRTRTREFRLPAIDETARTAGQRWGGTLAYWQEEGANGSLLGSLGKVGEIDFNVKRLVIYSQPISNDLVNDSLLLQGYLDYVAGSELAYGLDDALINGGSPGGAPVVGALAATCGIEVAPENAQSANTVVKENVAKIWARMWPPSRRNAIWTMTAETLEKIDELAAADGWPVSFYLPAGAAGNELPLIKGRPVVTVEQSPALGKRGDVLLCDWSQIGLALHVDEYGRSTEVTSVDRETLAASIERRVNNTTLFEQDLCVYAWKIRADVRPLWARPVLPANGTASQSPIVFLGAR